MIVKLGTDDVRLIIAKHFGIELEQVGTDEDSNYSLEVENIIPTKKEILR